MYQAPVRVYQRPNAAQRRPKDDRKIRPLGHASLLSEC
jgi:hypothetical protein